MGRVRDMEKAVRKCVVTITAGDLWEKVADITHGPMRAYAERIGADWLCIRDHDGILGKAHPKALKLELRRLLREGYDRIIYIDSDCLVRDDCPDLFAEVPEEKIGLFEEGRFTTRGPVMQLHLRKMGMNGAAKSEIEKAEKWMGCGRYYNDSVVVLSKKHAGVLSIEPWCEHKLDLSAHLNFLIHSYGHEVHLLSHRFNRMQFLDHITGENPLASYILHFQGQITHARDLAMLEGVLEQWKSVDRKTFDRRLIWLEVKGGLGDQICAEPVARHLRQRFFPGDHMVVSTDFPEAFASLKDFGVQVVKAGEMAYNRAYFRMETYPHDSNPALAFISPALTHSTDFAALCAFKGTLDNADKRIKLVTEPLDTFGDLEGIIRQSVVVHAGRTWESRTFPSSWWEQVIEGLLEKGLDVVLVGQDSKDKGSVDLPHTILGHDKLLDLRNKLKLPELFRVIQIAPALVTNDSAPVHVAGAFNNWLFLVATSREACHVLPYRYGTQDQKVVTYGKILERDMAPNCTTAVDLVHATPEEILAALPDPRELVDDVERAVENNV